MSYEYPPQNPAGSIENPPAILPVTCRAKYEDGVFKPLGFVTVPDGEEVTIAWKRESRPEWVDRPPFIGPPAPPHPDDPLREMFYDEMRRTNEERGVHPDYHGFTSLSTDGLAYLWACGRT